MKKIIYYPLLLLSIAAFLFVNKNMNRQLAQISHWDIPETVLLHTNPILALEFMRNPTDLEKILLGNTEGKVEAFRDNLQWDFHYIIAYIILFSLLATGIFAQRPKWRNTLIGLSLLAGLLDLMENLSLLHFLKNGNGSFSKLSAFVYAKWALIAIIALSLIGGLLWKGVKKLSRCHIA